MGLGQYWNKRFEKKFKYGVIEALECKRCGCILQEKQGEKHVAYLKARWKVHQYFHLIMLEDVDYKANWDCGIIPGFWSMHSVASMDDVDITLLKLQKLSCFYPKCIDDNFEFCEQKAHVKPWTFIRLQPYNIAQVSLFIMFVCFCIFVIDMFWTLLFQLLFSQV